MNIFAVKLLLVEICATFNFRKANAAACLTTWLLSMCLPIIFFVFKCKYRYSSEVGSSCKGNGSVYDVKNIYYNVCMDFSKPAQLLISVVVYCSYAVVFVVIAIYAGLFWMLRFKKCQVSGCLKCITNSGVSSVRLGWRLGYQRCKQASFDRAPQSSSSMP